MPVCRADGRRFAFDHLADVAQPYGLAGAMQQGHLRQLLRCEGLSFAIDDDALVFILDITRTTHACGLACCLHHLRQADVVADELLWIHLNLQLSDLAAKHVDIRHARHGHQVGTYGPVNQGAQFGQRAFVRGDPYAQHSAGRGSERRDIGNDAMRQLAVKGAQPFGHYLPVAIDIGAGFEQDGDQRGQG